MNNNEYNNIEIDKRIKDCLNDRLGNMVKELKNKGCSQDCQSKEMKMGSAGSISKYINGQSNLTATNLYKFAKFYDCSADFLIGLSECKNHNNQKIHLKIGLSDKAIENLKNITNIMKNDKSDISKNKYMHKIKMLNYLIENIEDLP